MNVDHPPVYALMEREINTRRALSVPLERGAE